MINPDYRQERGCSAHVKKVCNQGIKLLPLCIIGILFAGSAMFQPNSSIQKPVIVFRPTPINSSTLSGLTQLFQEVASSMNYEQASQLCVESWTGSSLVVGESGSLTIDDEALSTFKGQGPYSQSALQGMLAHEVSHLILGHPLQTWTYEQTLKRDLEQRLGPSSFRESEEKAAVRRNEEEKIQRQLSSFERSNEIAADEYAAQFPQLGRGLHDSFQRLIELHPEDNIERPSYPSYSQRLESVTKILCKTAPEKNQDIC